MATKRVGKKVPVPAGDRGGSLNSSQRLVVKARAYGAEDTDGTTPQANQIPALDFEEYLMPPTNPAVWSECPEQSTRLTRSIDILATNVVGFGWEIAAGVRPGHKLDAKQRKQFEAERAVLEEFFEYANPTLPVTSVFKHGLVDCETTGDGYYEVPRNMKGEPDGLYYVQSVTTRVRKNGDGFVQGRGDEKRYFKNYGDKRIIGAFDGKVYADKDGTWFSKDKKPADLPMKMRATELLHIRVFTTRSIHYGIPRWAACAPAIVGNRAAAERNVNFFANDATPRLVITVSGGKLGAEASKMIEGFLRREGKGTKNAHRCLLLQVEGKKLTLGQENKVDIQVTPLTVGTVEDASFLQYRKANDEEIREAFGITEPYYTSANANRAGAEVGRRITEEGMFEPIRREIEYLINQTLCRDLGATVARFRFIRPNSLDELEDVNVDQRMAQSWAMTPNEMRAKRGLPPLEDPLLGDKPFPWLAAAALAGGLPGIPAKVQPGPKPGSENQGPKEPKPPLKRGAPVAGKPRRLRTKSVEDAEAVGSMLKGVLEMFGIEANVQVGSDERPLESVIAEAQALAQEGSDVPQAG